MRFYFFISKHWCALFFYFSNRTSKRSFGAISRVLKEENIPLVEVVKKQKRSSDRVRSFERATAMQLWQTDITSFVLARNGTRVYLTVFLDDYSRYIVAWNLQLRQTSEFVMNTVLDGFQNYGKPEEILTDQGRQYFSWRGKSDFQRMLDKEGIKHVVARSHHPQTVGKCERLWETVGQEFWNRVRPQELSDARERLKHYFNHYNHFRPHQGIDGMVPADRFFGVESEVRRVLEESIEQNSLRMALDEAPRSPVFLVGNIGGKSVSLHGEGGHLIFQSPDGVISKIKTNEFGFTQIKGEENGRADIEKDSSKENAKETITNAGEASNTDQNTLASGERGSKEVAHQTGMIMLEYWMGRLSKMEAAKALNVPTLRLWQMSQQASSGMLVGLLKQPTVRTKDMKKNPDLDVKALQKKIAELERTIEMQDRLIAIMREMPGLQQVKLPKTPRKEKKIAEKKTIQKRVQKRDRSLASGTRTKSKNGRSSNEIGSDKANSTLVESKS